MLTHKKILLIDLNELLFKSLFVYHRMKKLSVNFFLLRTLISYIKKFPDREVILAVDGKHNWRKKVYTAYKAQRKELREKLDIDWEKVFLSFKSLYMNIASHTRIKVIRVDTLEGDDIIAVLAKQADDAIICSSDKDMEQLTYFDHVQLYSPKSKKIKQVKDPLRILSKHIDKGDIADNVPKATTQQQKQINKILIDLINLPQEVINKVQKARPICRSVQPNINLFFQIYPFKFLREARRLLERK